MKVKLSKTFEVNAPSKDVWNFMTDVKKVSTCIPGAEYLEDLGDTSTLADPTVVNDLIHNRRTPQGGAVHQKNVT